MLGDLVRGFAFILLFLANSAHAEFSKTYACPSESTRSHSQWRLVWHDDFLKDGAIDAKKWKSEIGPDNNNHEAQYYTARSQNLRIENHHLVLEARKENFEGMEYTSARISSNESWKYGRYETCAKLPSGVGTWPAIWMVAKKLFYGEQLWPDNGELDIMEAVGFRSLETFSTVHTADYNSYYNTQKTLGTSVPDMYAGFHLYAMEWFKDHIDFYVDKNKFFSFTKESSDWRKWPFDKKFIFIMNLSIGGDWGGIEGIDPNAFPNRMEIDFVHIFKKL